MWYFSADYQKWWLTFGRDFSPSILVEDIPPEQQFIQGLLGCVKPTSSPLSGSQGMSTSMHKLHGISQHRSNSRGLPSIKAGNERRSWPLIESFGDSDQQEFIFPVSPSLMSFENDDFLIASSLTFFPLGWSACEHDDLQLRRHRTHFSRFANSSPVTHQTCRENIFYLSEQLWLFMLCHSDCPHRLLDYWSVKKTQSSQIRYAGSCYALHSTCRE